MSRYILPAWRKVGQASSLSGKFNDWRHEQVREAVGKPGLSACDNDDFCPLVAHFCELQGKSDEALNWLLRANGDKRRRIEHRMAQAMQRGGFSPVYVQQICRDEYKCVVEDATDEQLVNLCKTLTARQAAKTRRAGPLCASAPLRENQETHEPARV